MYAVTLAGKRRVAYERAGGLTIHDVARDGRWLATREDLRYGSMVHAPGSTEDRDLSWLDPSHGRDLSQDGQTLLFAETTDRNQLRGVPPKDRWLARGAAGGGMADGPVRRRQVGARRGPIRGRRSS